jgi:hypothetical protein
MHGLVKVSDHEDPALLGAEADLMSELEHLHELSGLEFAYDHGLNLFEKQT